MKKIVIAGVKKSAAPGCQNFEDFLFGWLKQHETAIIYLKIPKVAGRQFFYRVGLLQGAGPNG